MTLTCTVCICLLVQGCFEHARRGNEALLSFEGCVSVHGKPDLHSKCRDSRSVQSLEDLGSISQWQFWSTIANAQETSRNTFLIYTVVPNSSHQVSLIVDRLSSAEAIRVLSLKQLEKLKHHLRVLQHAA